MLDAQPAPSPSRRAFQGPLPAGMALLLIAASGCYVHVPADDPLPPPGASVRVTLEPEGIRRVRDEVGMDLEYLEGRLGEARGDSLVVSMLMSRLPGGGASTLRRNFALPMTEVDRVQREELSRSRTAMLAVGVGGILGYAISQFGAGSSGDPGPGNGDGDGSPVIIPWWSLGF